MHNVVAVPGPTRTLRLATALVIAVAAPLAAQTPTPTAEQIQSREAAFARLLEAARSDPRAYDRLEFLCDRIGPRIAGSAPFQQAVRWAEATFREDNHEAVRSEAVKVHLWVRGRERAVMTAPVERELPMLGLGESVGTPGIEAPVVVVRTLEELGPQVKGKIVLFAPDPPAGASAGDLYSIFSNLRTHGPSRAAAAGAVAALVRSVPPVSLATPHTGTLEYDADKPRIPAAALDAEHADWIARLARARRGGAGPARDGGPRRRPRGHRQRGGRDQGRGKPEEIVLIGAHLDSWDVGQGAQDDGVGVIHVIEAMRLIRGLGVRPARTIRGVSVRQRGARPRGRQGLCPGPQGGAAPGRGRNRPRQRQAREVERQREPAGAGVAPHRRETGGAAGRGGLVRRRHLSAQRSGGADRDPGRRRRALLRGSPLRGRHPRQGGPSGAARGSGRGRRHRLAACQCPAAVAWWAFTV